MATQSISRTQTRIRRDSNILNGVVGKVLSTALMIIFAVYFLVPLWWLFVSATKDNTDLFATPALWLGSKNVLWANFHDVFTRENSIFWRWTLNTIIQAGGSTVGATMISALGGYALAKYRFKGRDLFFKVMMGASMVPSTALILPLYLMMSKFGWINTHQAIIFPALASPFGLFLMRVYSVQAIPDEMLDASRIDGASEFRTFWSVALPLLRPGFVTVFLLLFVGNWNGFFLQQTVFSDPNMFPLTVGLVTWQAVQGGATNITYSTIITAALLICVPLLIIFSFAQRYWQTGLSMGAVKA